MESFRLSADGRLHRRLIEKYGRELTLKERFDNKVFGISCLQPSRTSNDFLGLWFESKNFSVRPHLDQLTNGLVFRLTDSKDINALAISYVELRSIRVMRSPDLVRPIPFSPFWTLTRLGFEPRKVRWMAISWGLEFQFGDVNVVLEFRDKSSLDLVCSARHEPTVRKFFRSPFLRKKVVFPVEDE